MLIVTHLFVGGLIGLLVQDPWQAGLLAFASHFLLDSIPHGDTHFAEALHDHKQGARRTLSVFYAGGDLLCALIGLLWVQTHTPDLFTGAVIVGLVGAVLPDVLVGIHEAAGQRLLRRFVQVHHTIHNAVSTRTGDLPLLPAVLGQCAVMLLVVFLWGR